MSDIEEDIKRCEKLTEPQNANWIGISNQMAIAGALARIKELEEENKEIKNTKMNGYLHENIWLAKYLSELYLPKQKVKDLLAKIQKEYEKLDKASDEFLNNKEKTAEDYVLEKERLVTMQTLAYCRDNLEELLEDK